MHETSYDYDVIVIGAGPAGRARTDHDGVVGWHQGVPPAVGLYLRPTRVLQDAPPSQMPQQGAGRTRSTLPVDARRGLRTGSGGI